MKNTMETTNDVPQEIQDKCTKIDIIVSIITKMASEVYAYKFAIVIIISVLTISENALDRRPVILSCLNRKFITRSPYCFASPERKISHIR